ncbi:AmmeMemoRadiSam system protein A [Candidatus Woesearchaeota archaeon]|nr:AmmeMemoRadiSam system protein A [Candidatus Woesearchaeota archaeon]
MKVEDKKTLLALARDSIYTYFQGKKPELSSVKRFSEKQGVFVTLHDKHGRLRGCIGFPIASHPLYVGVVEAARSAAFHDPRFPPLREDEFGETVIEISVLTIPKLIEISHYSDYLKKIIIGVDGLILEGPFGSGLLLPQVATENDFNIQRFLNCLSQKAGLGFNAWKDKENRIYSFQADVFSEKEE